MLTVVLSGSTFQIQQQEFCLRNKILPFFHHVSPYVRPSQVHLNFSQWFDGFVSHVSHESISSSSSTRSHMMIVIWSSYYHMDLTSTLWIVNALDFILSIFSLQGGITCGAIDEPRKSSKALDERVIINFCDKNVVIARFRDKNVVIARFRDKNVLSIAFLFYKYGKYI